MAETLTSIVETMYREDPNREEDEGVDAVVDYAASLFSKRDTAHFLREGVYKMLWDIRRGVKSQIRAEAAERRSQGSVSEVFLNEAGETFVIKPGPTAQVIARNRIESPAEEVFRASITPLAGRLYLRSTSKLHCIGPEGAGQ